MGTAELNFLRPEDLPKEGTLQDDQIDLIRASIEALEPEAYDRHVSAFANDVQAAVARATPETKPPSFSSPASAHPPPIPTTSPRPSSCRRSRTAPTW